ncbi:uncharacterized protein MELLADRAFT_102614 [Melampsora larici-populina 98AG31]|uniref:Uncharacterized protein n=1 Tax=Melampsora larici-populina (strain 98AG31 / pathotype 3-4-7) TaxID=747676 RepID=F4R8U3_MELLP|nr:uncharacterized protein MELLADRAFT_102614 [Melampsora larici-populina 98AG31]EGG11269.1 hypothetical protein MELLADRAFT_102614 [Melampsora larici-populina 98AG31]
MSASMVLCRSRLFFDIESASSSAFVWSSESKIEDDAIGFEELAESGIKDVNVDQVSREGNEGEDNFGWKGGSDVEIEEEDDMDEDEVYKFFNHLNEEHIMIERPADQPQGALDQS